MINIHETLAQMRQLRLTGMADRYHLLTELANQHDQPDAHTMLAMLVEAELLARTQKRTDLYIKLARFRYQVNAEEFNCSAERGLDKGLWMLLCEGSFVRQCKNILIDGATGSGKSHLVCALGRRICLNGQRTIYHNMNRFIEEIKAAKLDGTYLKLLDQYAKVPLLILDDFGLKPMDSEVRICLYEVLEDRIGKGSTIITSQFPVANWYSKFEDATLGEAILDRLTGYAERITLKGASWRNKRSK
jgi:DNA replication protein DnaC